MNDEQRKNVIKQTKIVKMSPVPLDRRPGFNVHV